MAADGALHFWRTHGMLYLGKLDLFEQSHGADAIGLAAVVNDRRA